MSAGVSQSAADSKKVEKRIKEGEEKEEEEEEQREKRKKKGNKRVTKCSLHLSCCMPASCVHGVARVQEATHVDHTACQKHTYT